MTVENVTLSAEQNSSSNEQKKQKSKAIRTLLIGATLSTALVSFLSTAQGMSMYIFPGKILFPLVLSGAIQGTLYTLSISGVPLLKSNMMHGFVKKGLAIMLWVCLLFASSIFSFVFVSKIAYSEAVMRSDAEQNMIQYLLDESYELLDYVNVLTEKSRQGMHNYINILLGDSRDGSGSQISNKHKEEIGKYIVVLQSYDDNTGDSSPDNSLISIGRYYRSNAIVNALETINNGQYEEADVIQLKKAINDTLSSVQNGIADCQSSIEAYDKELNGDPDTEKPGLNARAFQFHNVRDPQYLSLRAQIDDVINNKNLFDKLKTKLGNLEAFLSADLLNYVTISFEQGVDNTIQVKVRKLLGELNRENVEVQSVLNISEELYETLLDGHLSSGDGRISNYPSFKKSVASYGEYTLVKQSIESEIDKLSHYNREMFLGDADNTESTEQSTALTAGGNQNPESESASNSGMESKEEWTRFWTARLTNLMIEIQDLPEEIVANDTGGNIRKIDKSDILKNTSERKRLYLVDLNDFDRALTLFKETVCGFHNHGTMVVVSIVFAFGLDLFSLGMGILLYFFRPKRNGQRKDAPSVASV